MTARWRPPALWGVMLLVSGLVLLVWSSSVLQAAPLLLASAGALAIAALSVRGRWAHARRPAAAGLAAVGLTLALTAMIAGPWLALIGGALVVVAVVTGLWP
jgi:hypothetical protein